MPGRDGTGPIGTGPIGFRGRSAGRCVGPDFIGRNFAFGRGLAYRGRMGWHRGYGRYWMNLPQYNTPTVQPSVMNIDMNGLEHELSNIKKEIIELNQKLEEKQKIIDELQQKLDNK